MGPPGEGTIPAGVRGANVRPERRALGGGRLGGVRGLLAFAIGFMAVIGIAVAVVGLAARSTTPLCQPYKPCGTPPRNSAPLVRFTLWRSPEFGYTLEYPSSIATVAQQFPDGLTLALQLHNGDQVAILIRAAQASRLTPSQMIPSLVGGLTGVTQLATDPSSADAILGGGIGHQPGLGQPYVGSISSPQGVSSGADVAAQAATNGRVTIGALAVGATSDAGAQSELYGITDFIVNTVRWP